jgi:hypothetical protein
MNLATEREVVAAVLSWLRWCPHVAMAWRQNTGAVRFRADNGQDRFVRFGMAGVSDIIGWTNGGRFIAIECKSATGRLRPEQAGFLDALNRSGGIGILARSVNDVEARFRHEFGHVV